MFRALILAMTLTVAVTGIALATPSTQIWIPSTDIQPFMVGHLNVDNYFRASGVGKASGDPAKRDANVMDIGPTVGILPFEKIQMEIGFDYLVMATDPNDNHPWSGNFKIGTPEDSLFKYSPAIAVGMYNIGPSQGANAPAITSGQNIAYALIAKTLPAIGAVPSLGRISAGYYRGARGALVAPANPITGEVKSANEGVLLSWDRTMSEISDKLWLAVDYMGGNNVNGALNVGFSWAFAKNVSVIFGYDIWKEKSLAGNNTFTTQLDINFP
jgi:hypothetical protein